VDHSSPSTSDAVVRAVEALAHFRVDCRRTAATLLGLYAHVGDLTPEQRVEVLDHFAPPGPRVLLSTLDRQTRSGAAWLGRRSG